MSRSEPPLAAGRRNKYWGASPQAVRPVSVGRPTRLRGLSGLPQCFRTDDSTRPPAQQFLRLLPADRLSVWGGGRPRDAHPSPPPLRAWSPNESSNVWLPPREIR